MGNPKQIKNNRITLRFVNDLFDEIAKRARACNLTLTVYLQNSIESALLSNKSVTLPTSVTPPDRLGGALRDRDLEIYRTYLLWHQELRSQGNNLARITQAIHAANLDDRPIDPTNCLRVLSSIAIANREIALAIAKLEPKL